MVNNSKRNIYLYVPILDEQGPRSIRANYIAKYIDRDKFKVHLITNEIGFINHDLNDLSITRLKMPIVYRLAFLPKFNSTNTFINKIISKLLRKFLSFNLKLDYWEFQQKAFLAWTENNIKSNDIIIFSIIPFSNYLLSDKIFNKRKIEVCIILDIGDPLCANAVKIEENKNSSHFDIESRALQNADLIVVTNERTKSLFIETYGLSDKVSVVPQGFDKNIFYPKQNNFKSSKKIKLVYAGASYSKLRPINPLLHAIERLKGKYELDWCGPDSSQTKSNVNIIKKMSQVELVEVYGQADILIFIDNHFGIQTPGKIYELLAMKKPILFLYQSVTETYGIVKPYGQVSFVENEPNKIYDYLKDFDIDKVENSYDVDSLIHEWSERSIFFQNAIEKTINKKIKCQI